MSDLYPERNKIAWERALSFLDWDTDQLISHQDTSLIAQIRYLEKSQFHEKLFSVRNIRSVEEFRASVPLTDDASYSPIFSGQNAEGLSERPWSWLRTTGPTDSTPKWIPLSADAREQLSWATLGILITAQATKIGEVRLRDEVRILNLTAPPPFFTGTAVAAFADLQPWPAKLYPADDQVDGATSFDGRVARALSEAVHTDIDFVLSYSSVLAGIGQSFSNPNHPFGAPQDIRSRARLAHANASAALRHRSLLPRDVWSLQAIIAGGVDAVLFRNKIIEEWGLDPLELLASTDGLFMGMQTWDRTTTTLIPTFNFFEFIPEEEVAKEERNSSYSPSTVRFDELQGGKAYELVITNLLGGALVRYRTGETLRMISFENVMSGIRMPQFIHDGQRTESLEVAGFVRLSESKVAFVIEKSGLPVKDWVIKKELEDGMPIVSLRIEMNDAAVTGPTEELRKRIEIALREVDRDWRDMEDLANIRPLRLYVLPRGAFDELDRGGLRDRNFRRVNPSDSVVSFLDSPSHEPPKGVEFNASS